MAEPSYFEPRSMLAQVDITFDNHTALITLKGEIDLAISEALTFAAGEAIIRSVPVRVDLSDVTFLDSTGVGFLGELVRAGARASWRLTVIGPSRTVLETLAVSGLLPTLAVHQVSDWISS